VAEFTLSFINDRDPLTVQFTDLSGGSPLSWLWSFGDNESSTVQNPAHIYETSGIYTITLIVNGLDTVSHTVYISRALSATTVLSGNITLNGNINGNGDIQIRSGAVITPVADEDSKKEIWSYKANKYLKPNGTGRSITSSIYSISLNQGALVDGRYQGFESNRGPGNNTLRTGYNGYGATHAGKGYISTIGAPEPVKPYGHYETPVSLGSGGGFYHAPTDTDSLPSIGGGAIKIKARNGNVYIHGDINMDGQEGVRSGGAAGGSIWLVGRAVDGDGTMTVRGGGTQLVPDSGGGGGGYISVWHEHSYLFSGFMSAEGAMGGGHGKVFIKEIEPILEDKFTGHVLNAKWWDSTGAVSLNNQILYQSAQDNFNALRIQSRFKLAGDIIADVDLIPDTSQVSGYVASFLLYADPNNWIGLSRKYLGIYGVSCVDGIVTSSGIPCDFTNTALRIVKTDSTFNFEYNTADHTSVSQIIYTDIRPELERRKFSVVLDYYKLHGNPLVQNQRLSPLDIYNQYLDLDATVTDNTAVAFNVMTGVSQYFGKDFYVNPNDYRLRWDAPGLWIPDATPFGSLAAIGDVVRTIYDWNPPTDNSMNIAWDNFKVYDGIVTDAESRTPVLYVDPDYGSDSSSGDQVSPLKNLFVATAWAKRGGIVVLYDGTHNPAEVIRKDLTIRGAEGAKPVITSVNVQDTTGSGWETNGLSFYACQGRVENVKLSDSSIGLRFESSPYMAVTRCELADSSFGVRAINCDPDIIRTRIHNVGVGLDFTNCINSYIYGNTIYDSSVAIRAIDASRLDIDHNTIDDCTTGVTLSKSYAYITSNNITNGGLGVEATTDSTFFSYNNNFYDTTDYNRVPDGTSANIDTDPMYVDRPNKDFHLGTTSPDIGTDTTVYDSLRIDYDGVNRADTSDIGSYRYLSVGAHTGDYYVTAYGDDYTNSGSFNDPFRTLDKAMMVADATVHIDGGHYDTYYLNLKSQSIDLNSLFIYTRPINHLVSYYTLTAENITNGYLHLPGWLDSAADNSNVALNVIGGGSFVYNQDYYVSAGLLAWKDMSLEPYLAMGDTLRVLYLGVLQQKALNTLVMHPHFSNLELERALFVSPSGSDRTGMGGDGTNTGGNGTFSRPYRTINRALSQSVSGDYVVAIAGEYPIFNGLDNRVIVPAVVRSSFDDKEPKQYLEDFFAPKAFGPLEDTEYALSLWDFTYSGRSYVQENYGFLSMAYDGTNTVVANSRFSVFGNFEIATDLRNVIDPVTFRAVGGDNTVFFTYNEGDYTSGVFTGGRLYTCTGHLTDAPIDTNAFITEYIPLSQTDVRRQYVPLSYMPDPFDCSNFSLNIAGGAPQNYGTDFYVEDAYIKWDGMTLESELEAGDIFRIIYK